MSQSTFDDDELFGEAANEIRSDVEASLDEAAASLPDTADIWEVDADNTLGALNTLRSALDVGDAEDHLRDAKKWFTMGQRADAFEDADDLEARIESLEDAIEDIGDAKEKVGDLASTVPGLKGTLEDLHAAAEESEAEDEETDDADENEAEADDDAEAAEA
ncbi:DUF5790 family protein [Halorussus halophilus]|uniref:DUF5790 family protein n=1 Tax=Halorussus halophilus TaxID=2650975 RepID=UPI00130102AA|nr:DUF5790 family protein [Halorussus halophilus]